MLPRLVVVHPVVLLTISRSTPPAVLAVPVQFQMFRMAPVVQEETEPRVRMLLPEEIAPKSMVELAVKVSVPSESLTPVPDCLMVKFPPASASDVELLVAELTLSKRVPPVVTVIFDVLPSAFVAFAESVPALTVVVPVLVFAPERVRVPRPALVKVPVPVMGPEKVLLKLLVSIVPALLR